MFSLLLAALVLDRKGLTISWRIIKKSVREGHNIIFPFTLYPLEAGASVVSLDIINRNPRRFSLNP